MEGKLAYVMCRMTSLLLLLYANVEILEPENENSAIIYFLCMPIESQMKFCRL